MFNLYAIKTQLALRQREPVTSGSVNVCQVQFEFSADWKGLDRTAVFRCGGEAVSVPLGLDGTCAIPWEVLQWPGRRLEAGVYGTRDGEIVLPTIWANLGIVLEGASPGAEARPPMTKPQDQELARKGDGLGYTEDGELGLYAGDTLLSAVPLPDMELPWDIGHGLKLEDGSLTVDTVDDFDGDKTLPMTAAGIQTVVGNIDVLLGTI